MNRLLALFSAVVVLYCSADVTLAAADNVCDKGDIEGCKNRLNFEDVVTKDKDMWEAKCTTDVPNARKCLTNAGCSVDHALMKKYWNKFNEFIAYLCGDAKAEYLKNRNCFSNATVGNALTSKCAVPYQASAGPNVVTTTEPLCVIENANLRCVYKVMKEHCGEGGAEVYGTIMYKQKVSYLTEKDITCDLTDPTGAAIISSHMSILLIIAAIIGAVLLN